MCVCVCVCVCVCARARAHACVPACVYLKYEKRYNSVWATCFAEGGRGWEERMPAHQNITIALLEKNPVELNDDKACARREK